VLSKRKTILLVIHNHWQLNFIFRSYLHLVVKDNKLDNVLLFHSSDIRLISVKKCQLCTVYRPNWLGKDNILKIVEKMSLCISFSNVCLVDYNTNTTLMKHSKRPIPMNDMVYRNIDGTLCISRIIDEPHLITARYIILIE